MNISLTFNWSFIDLFIILLSLAISTKFKMINERLEFFKGRVRFFNNFFSFLNLFSKSQNISGSFWDEIRCHYNKVCELNEFVDGILGNLICVACLSDLYYGNVSFAYKSLFISLKLSQFVFSCLTSLQSSLFLRIKFTFGTR